MEEKSRVQKAKKIAKYVVLGLSAKPFGFKIAGAKIGKVKPKPELTRESDMTFLSSVKKDMDKPRIARSARKEE